MSFITLEHCYRGWRMFLVLILFSVKYFPRVLLLSLKQLRFLRASKRFGVFMDKLTLLFLTSQGPRFFFHCG